MTGHRGARTNLPVALVTEDFRLYHRLAPFFEGYGITVLGLRPGHAVPASVRVLLGGPATDGRSVALRDDAEATLLATFAALDPRPGKRQGYAHVVFGVDPGQMIGLAAVADGETLLVGEARSVQEATDRVAAWASGLAARVWEVHVGDGAPDAGRSLVASIARRLPGARVSLVSEEGTSPWFAVTGSRHADAAILIALRPAPDSAPRGPRARDEGAKPARVEHHEAPDSAPSPHAPAPRKARSQPLSGGGRNVTR